MDKFVLLMAMTLFLSGVAVGAWAMRTWGMTEIVLVETIAVLDPPTMGFE